MIFVDEVVAILEKRVYNDLYPRVEYYIQDWILAKYVGFPSIYNYFSPTLTCYVLFTPCKTEM